MLQSFYRLKKLHNYQAGLSSGQARVDGQMVLAHLRTFRLWKNMWNSLNSMCGGQFPHGFPQKNALFQALLPSSALVRKFI